MMLSPGHPDAPKYWMWETSGALKSVVRAYLEGHELDPLEMKIMRDYLRQWILSPVWADADGNGHLQTLRENVSKLRNRADVAKWLHDALAIEIDPL